MEDFVRGTVDDSNEEFSPLAIRAKAAALYDRAIYVSSQYRVGRWPLLSLLSPSRSSQSAKTTITCSFDRHAQQKRLLESFQLTRRHHRKISPATRRGHKPQARRYARAIGITHFCVCGCDPAPFCVLQLPADIAEEDHLCCHLLGSCPGYCRRQPVPALGSRHRSKCGAHGLNAQVTDTCIC